MDQQQFQKAVAAADRLLLGEQADVSAAELEDTLMDYAESQRAPGESGPACFARLAKSRDVTVEKLHAAVDAQRLVERHGSAVMGAVISPFRKAAARHYQKVEEEIDELVRSRKSPDESDVEAMSRLDRDGDESLRRLRGLLREAFEIASDG